jgi:hypothetical protein
MKIRLFQELFTLNEESGHVIDGLERMEQPKGCPLREFPLSKWK